MSNIMPAAAPPPVPGAYALLLTLGRRIREHRKAMRVSATAASEAAGLSRVTWHRIERGEPSVTMGAYVNAMLTLGLQPDIAQAPAPPNMAGATSAIEPGAAATPAIRVGDYPQLKRLAWQLPATFELAPAEALGLYERHWRHVAEPLDPHEQALVERLRCTVGKGHLLV